MLGVATLIVVNAVMSGFSTKLKDRLHGFLSDITIEGYGFEGFPDPEGKMALIRNDPFLKEHVVAMAPTLECFGMLQYKYLGQTVTRPVHIVAIDPKSRAELGGFKEFLQNENNRRSPTFDLSKEAQARYDRNHEE